MQYILVYFHSWKHQFYVDFFGSYATEEEAEARREGLLKASVDQWDIPPEEFEKLDDSDKLPYKTTMTEENLKILEYDSTHLQPLTLLAELSFN